MKLNREQIVKALECCLADRVICDNCPIQDECESNLFNATLLKYALSTINELTEENERLSQNNLVFAQGVEKVAANYYNLGCTDTVQKMQEMLKPIFVDKSYTLYTGACVHDTIDQIAKEMLEDTE